MARGPATAEIVVVHRRKVVVHQRIGVDHLDGAGEWKDRTRRGARRLAGRERDDGTEPLAAAEEAVAHRLPEPAPTRR